MKDTEIRLGHGLNVMRKFSEPNKRILTCEPSSTVQGVSLGRYGREGRESHFIATFRIEVEDRNLPMGPPPPARLPKKLSYSGLVTLPRQTLCSP